MQISLQCKNIDLSGFQFTASFPEQFSHVADEHNDSQYKQNEPCRN